MATESNIIDSDRQRSLSAEDDMMFMLGNPFGDVSDNIIGSSALIHPPQILPRPAVANLLVDAYAYELSCYNDAAGRMGRGI